MSAARHFPRQLIIGLLSALLILALTTPVWAQYTIPDCYVAAINGAFPGEEYAASRDQLYKQDSGRWNAEIAGLTPAQLEGYRAFFCANVRVIDTGKDADGTQNFAVNWVSADAYLKSIGQRRGQGGGGGSSGSTGGTSSGNTGSTGSGGSTSSTGSGKTGAGAIASPVDIPVVDPADLLFDADFDRLPDHLELRDADNNVIDASVTTDAKDTILKIEADTTRSLYITDAAQWTDYAVEARVKVRNGSLILSTRTADDDCSSYDFYVEPATGYGSVQKSDENCDRKLLQDRSDLATIKAGKWTTLRLENASDQLNALIDGTKVLSASDSTYTEGFPALYLFPDEGKTATLEIDSLRVITIHPPPETLADYDKTPAEAVAELQSLNQLPASKGTLVFLQKSAFAAGKGIHYFAMAPHSPRTDIVMAATLKFTAPESSESQDCTLMARFTSSSSGAEAITFGFNSDGYLTVGDFAGQDGQPRLVTSPSADYPPGKAYHLLVTLIGAQAVVYVDGARVLTVDQLAATPGTYMLALYGANGNARCDATNFWAYSFK